MTENETTASETAVGTTFHVPGAYSVTTPVNVPIVFIRRFGQPGGAKEAKKVRLYLEWEGAELQQISLNHTPIPDWKNDWISHLLQQRNELRLSFVPTGPILRLVTCQLHIIEAD